VTFYGPYDRHLSADERASVAKARDFCTGRFSSEAHAAYRAGQAIPETWFAKWAETGLLGLQAKTEHGGLGASFMCKIRVAQEVARHSFAMAFCVNHHQGSVTRLSKTGSERQQQELLGEMLKGRILATIAMTEPQGGSDAAAMVTAARPVGRYAISFVWSDGHDHGIYPYTLLRDLCPCPACRARRQGP
jgi:alkylation response protein AidB-like acyl-CoA dehydrogenase